MASARDPIDRIIGSMPEIVRAMRHKIFCDTKDGLHPGQLHAMFIISEHPGMTMKELATLLHITSPSATSLINRVVLLKLVQRKHDAHNRKLVRLGLTKKGTALLHKKHSDRNKVLRELFATLSTAEQSQLASIHEKLVLNIRTRFLL